MRYPLTAILASASGFGRTGALLCLLLALVQCTGEEPPVSSPSAVAAMPAVATKTSVAVPADGVPSNQTFIAVAKTSRASVVNIASTRKVAGGQGLPSPFFDDPFWRRFFGDEFERRFREPQERRQQGMGSGVIVGPSGYIVTNNHVVAGADEIEVLLSDKRRFKAELVGTDPKTDIALIKIDSEQLPVLPWGDSGNLQVGEMVMAVGNPFGLNQTVTLGIISAVGRANMGIVDYEDFIQTDAAINPGNSGGALVNLRGELIGINTAIFSRSGGYMGIGFAIPSNMVKSVMTSLRKHGRVVRGWLGVSIQEMTPDLVEQFSAPSPKGALVADVVDRSPAQEGQLQRGDIITKYNGRAVDNPTHLRAMVADTEPNRAVTLTVYRAKRSVNLRVTIGELPKDLAQASRGGPGGTRGDHALAGITMQNLPPGQRDPSGRRLTGVKVAGVEPGSTAERAGLRQGDIIQEINRKPVRDVDAFERLTRALAPEKAVLVLLRRGNATIFLSVNPR